MTELDAPVRVFLLSLTHTDDAGVLRNYDIEIVDGKMVSSGDLPPDEAAEIFFETFKKQCGDEFMRMAQEFLVQSARAHFGSGPIA